MHSEVPVCTRCCFCLPLRHGLLAWGYLKLVLFGLSFMTLVMIVTRAIAMSKYAEYRVEIIDIITVCIISSIALTDFSLTVTYIVGCHKKNVKLMEIYYFYSSVIVTLVAAFCGYCFFSSLYYTIKYSTNILVSSMYQIIDGSLLFSNVVMQIYMILLIRSEIVKLTSRNEFRFTNIATEAECTLKINNNEDQEMEKKDDEVNYDNKMSMCA